MKYLYLETLSDFECIGDKCEFTCCGGGWSIIIDKETDTYYRSVTGEMGDRLNKCIRRDGDKSSFILDEHGNCPFLNEKGLCDIYINLGEEHLSNTCTYYPRYTFYSGDICFGGVSISCPEVARFFLTHKDPLLIDYAEDDKTLSAEEEQSTDWVLFNNAIHVLTSSVDIIQNRNLSIRERLSLVILFVDQFQKNTDACQDVSTLIKVFSSPSEYTQLLAQANTPERDYSSKIDYCSEFLTIFSQTDRFEERLPEIFDLVSYFSKDENASFDLEKWSKAFDQVYSDDYSVWKENILIYIIFRYFMQGFAKKDFYNSLMTGINAIYNICIFDLALYHIKNGAVPQNTDYMIMLTAHISRMVEHCTDFRNDVFKHFLDKNMNDMPFLLRLIS